jgi:MFS family permease
MKEKLTYTTKWFAHERPLYLAIYGFSLAFSGKFAPVFAAFINTGQGWRWTLWWCAIAIAVAFVYCLFLMEETNYDRRTSQSTTGTDETTSEFTIQNVAGEKGSESETPTPAEATSSARDYTVYPRKTYRQKLSVIDRKRPNRILHLMWAPFKFFRFPVVVWAGFMYGTNALVWTGILNATASPIYTSAPYRFNSNEVGFAYFGGVVGMLVGCASIPPPLPLRVFYR